MPDFLAFKDKLVKKVTGIQDKIGDNPVVKYGLMPLTKVIMPEKICRIWDGIEMSAFKKDVADMEKKYTREVENVREQMRELLETVEKNSSPEVQEAFGKIDEEKVRMIAHQIMAEKDEEYEKKYKTIEEQTVQSARVMNDSLESVVNINKELADRIKYLQSSIDVLEAKMKKEKKSEFETYYIISQLIHDSPKNEYKRITGETQQYVSIDALAERAGSDPADGITGIYEKVEEMQDMLQKLAEGPVYEEREQYRARFAELQGLTAEASWEEIYKETANCATIRDAINQEQ